MMICRADNSRGHLFEIVKFLWSGGELERAAPSRRQDALGTPSPVRGMDIMTIEDNKRLALRFLEALGDQGYGAFADPRLVTEDFVWWVQSKGEFTGAQMVELSRPVGQQFAGPSRRIIKGVTAEGDRVALEYESDTPLKNGKRYRNTYHCLYVFRDGRLASGKEYYDTAYVRDTLDR
jgi:ketosteroid isomerase-like protein